MMEYYFQRQYFFLFFFLLCSGFLSFSAAYNFTADENHGWGFNKSKNNRWAGEYRFQINDIIVFNYTKGSDSVLVVKNKADYDNCNNKTNSEKKLDAGDSFTFYRQGPFYFISENNCQKGQKLHVVVLSPRNPPPENPPGTRWPVNPAVLLVGSASLLLLVLLISKKKKK